MPPKKAFVMNRIGDLGFFVRHILIIHIFGSIEFATIFPQAATLTASEASTLNRNNPAAFCRRYR